MKKEQHIIAVAFLTLLTSVSGVVAAECYGKTRDNKPEGTACNQSPCSYTCEAPTYQVCDVDKKPTKKTCNEGPQKETGIYASTYVGGTCAGYSAGPPIVSGSCTGGTANKSVLEDPQPDKAALAGC